MSTFVAIDFETAMSRRDSACAVGLAAGSDGRIVASRTYPIRPPTPRFSFTRIHGLRWEDVRDAPTFADLWPTLRAWIDDAEFLAAHNAPFDQNVLFACCTRYRLRAPRTPFTCTVQLARAQWGIYPTKLPDVCRQLRIPLRHHDSGSDAEACARIVLAAEAEGWRRTSRSVVMSCDRAAGHTDRPAAPWSALLLPAAERVPRARARRRIVRLIRTCWRRLGRCVAALGHGPQTY